jgi:hypothetical protein
MIVSVIKFSHTNVSRQKQRSKGVGVMSELSPLAYFLLKGDFVDGLESYAK